MKLKKKISNSLSSHFFYFLIITFSIRLKLYIVSEQKGDKSAKDTIGFLNTIACHAITIASDFGFVLYSELIKPIKTLSYDLQMQIILWTTAHDATVITTRTQWRRVRKRHPRLVDRLFLEWFELLKIFHRHLCCDTQIDWLKICYGDYCVCVIGFWLLNYFTKRLPRAPLQATSCAPLGCTHKH